ncbi:unnamed protein product [Caenorhabditis auriculariae]|uniref:guanylate cyclase n=1 Tax=Caenorhabditis auriculariae TaxID=2777116 RepID=A0A8S1HM46_9PELO|nr:unnamed protein product [Caenorhabditis auriculariae]
MIQLSCTSSQSEKTPTFGARCSSESDFFSTSSSSQGLTLGSEFSETSISLTKLLVLQTVFQKFELLAKLADHWKTPMVFFGLNPDLARKLEPSSKWKNRQLNFALAESSWKFLAALCSLLVKRNYPLVHIITDDRSTLRSLQMRNCLWEAGIKTASKSFEESEEFFSDKDGVYVITLSDDDYTRKVVGTIQGARPTEVWLSSVSQPATISSVCPRCILPVQSKSGTSLKDDLMDVLTILERPSDDSSTIDVKDQKSRSSRARERISELLEKKRHFTATWARKSGPIARVNCVDENCREPEITELEEDFWEKRIPETTQLDEKNIETAVAMVLLTTFALAVFFLTVFVHKIFTLCMQKSLGEIKLDWNYPAESLRSLKPRSTEGENFSLRRNRAVLAGVEGKLLYRKLRLRERLRIEKCDLKLLKKMKLVNHENVSSFVGICVRRNGILFLWSDCPRGTLKDLIYSSKFTRNPKVNGCLLHEIITGLEYLHSSPTAHHGKLTSTTVVFDRNWTLKLCDFGVDFFENKWSDGKERDQDRLEWLYAAPEVRKKKRSKKKSLGSVEERQAADIYSLGIVAYEIYFCSLPFPDQQDILELANQAYEGHDIGRPKIRESWKFDSVLQNMIEKCWSEKWMIRPKAESVRFLVDSSIKRAESIADAMIDVIDTYTKSLNRRLQETDALKEEAVDRADRLLQHLVPRSFFAEMKTSGQISPRTTSSSSVFYSDFQGSRAFFRKFSPTEMVIYLNKIYSKFDLLANEYNCSKISVVGDVFLVASGLQGEAGTRHVANIANYSLQFLRVCFQPHESQTLFSFSKKATGCFEMENH